MCRQEHGAAPLPSHAEPLEETQGDRAAGGILFVLAYLAADDGQWAHAAQRIHRLKNFYRETSDARRLAEIDLLGALSACPGGDCSATHSSDAAACHPLKIEIFEPDRATLKDWTWPAPSAYHRHHGA